MLLFILQLAAMQIAPAPPPLMPDNSGAFDQSDGAPLSPQPRGFRSRMGRKQAKLVSGIAPR